MNEIPENIHFKPSSEKTNPYQIKDDNISDNKILTKDTDILESLSESNMSDNCSYKSDINIKEVMNMNNTDDSIDEHEIVDNDKNCFDDTTLMYNNNLCHEIQLLKIINQLGMPLYSYKKIINWAQEVCASQHQFQPQNTTYGQAISYFESMFHLSNCRPVKVPVKLHGDNMELDVVTFNIPAMLESLFNDSKINRYENLVVNPSNRFGKYKASNGRLEEVNSGQWYLTAYKNCIENPETDFLCPIILASDKTTLSEIGDLHVDAIFMTTSKFNNEVSYLQCLNKTLFI
jgi:hypothetical protein